MNKRLLIGFLTCFLLSGFANTARADPCPPPSCPDCYTWNGSACVWACGAGSCCGGSCCSNTCCNGVCCAAGQICCGGVCCDPAKCCNGVCYSANQCYYNGKCYDSLGSCKTDFGDPYCSHVTGCGCDPINAGCGDKEQILPGSEYHFCPEEEGEGKRINLGPVLCRYTRACQEAGYRYMQLCYCINPTVPEGYCTAAPWPYCQDCVGLGLAIPEYYDDFRCCFCP